MECDGQSSTTCACPLWPTALRLFKVTSTATKIMEAIRLYTKNPGLLCQNFFDARFKGVLAWLAFGHKKETPPAEANLCEGYVFLMNSFCTYRYIIKALSINDNSNI